MQNASIVNLHHCSFVFIRFVSQQQQQWQYSLQMCQIQLNDWFDSIRSIDSFRLVNELNRKSFDHHSGMFTKVNKWKKNSFEFFFKDKFCDFFFVAGVNKQQKKKSSLIYRWSLWQYHDDWKIVIQFNWCVHHHHHHRSSYRRKCLVIINIEWIELNE